MIPPRHQPFVAPVIFIMICMASTLGGCRDEPGSDPSRDTAAPDNESSSNDRRITPMPAFTRAALVKMIEEIDGPDQRAAGLALQGFPTNPGHYIENPDLARELVVPTLVRLMNDRKRPPLQGLAISKLMGMGGLAASAWSEIEQALHKPELRPYLMQGLADMGPLGERAIPTLIRMIQNSDTQERVAACRGLERFKNRAAAAVPELTKLLDNDDVVVQVAASAALGAMGKEASAALAKLEELAHAKNKAIQLAAQRAIARIKKGN